MTEIPAGEMARLVRELDWSATPLGPISTWPRSLATIVDLVLAHPMPSVVLWGPDLVQVSNDAHARIAGDQHPGALGRPTREGWPEVWHLNAPRFERVLATGESILLENQLFPITRHGERGDAYFTLAYSPVRDDDDRIAGVLLTIIETTARVRAEAELRASEGGFRSLVTASSDVLYRMSPDWSEMRLLHSRGFLANTETSDPAWLGAYIPPEEQPRVLAAIASAIEAKRPFDLEHQVRRADGTIGWTHSRAVPLLGDGGEVVEWFGAASNVTSRVKADQGFTRLFKASPAPFVILKPDAPRFPIAEVNDSYLAATMRTREEVVGRGIFEAFPDKPDDATIAGVRTLRASIERVLASRQSDELPGLKYDIARPDGTFEERWWRLVNSPVLDEGGEVEAIILNAHDITEERRGEQALRESEAKYRTLFEMMGQGYTLAELVRDDAGRAVDYRLLEMNPAFERLIGVPVADARGRSVREVIPGLEDWWVEEFDRVVRGGRPERIEHEVAALDRWYEVHAYPGPGDRFTTLYEEITDRKRSEAALRESEARQAFLLSLSDALRPLADAVEIQETAMRVLGVHVKAHRAFYGDAANDNDTLMIGPGYSHELAPLEGQVHFSDFDLDMLAMYRAGTTVVIDDVHEDARFTARARAAFDAIGVRAAVGVPLIKGDRVRAIVSLHQSVPRRWTAAEAALLEETGERTWAAVERAKAEAGLRESEGRLRAVAANLPSGAVFLVDRDLRYVLAGGEALGGAGLASSDLEGRTLAEVTPPDSLPEYVANYRRALAGETFRVEHAAHGRHFITHGMPLAKEHGSATAALAVSYDITDRMRAEERLRLALAAARMGTWRWVVDDDSHQRDANLNRLLGRPAEESAGPLSDFLACIHPADRERVSRVFHESVRNGRNMRVEFRISWPDGSVRWLRDQGDLFGGPEGRYLAGACVDVTDLKEAEAALQRANDELEARVAERTADLARRTADLEVESARRRDLARRLVTAQEDERRRISRDLHDSAGQLLVGLGLAFKTAEAGDLSPATAGKLSEARRIVEVLTREIHDMAVRLRPTSIDDVGLEPSLRHLVAEWSARTGIQADFRAMGLHLGRLPTEMETAIYRAVQEALTNIAKHADASAVSVTVVRPDGVVTATIEDDGSGFDPGATPRGRLGLAGMRERVAAAGGEVEIESAPGSGATIFLRFPIAHPDRGAGPIGQAPSPG